MRLMSVYCQDLGEHMNTFFRFCLAAAIVAPVSFAATSCEDLGKLTLPNATITSAQSVAAGSFAAPEGGPVQVAVAFCPVALVLKPSTDSDIELKVWLPASG